MAAQYITRDGDILDDIASKHYGSTANRVVEQVLAANHGLADYGPAMPAGLEITLPDIASPAQQQGTRLWD